MSNDNLLHNKTYFPGNISYSALKNPTVILRGFHLSYTKAIIAIGALSPLRL